MARLDAREGSRSGLSSMTWQLIGTAPRDGTPVDLWHRLGFRVTETWWDPEDRCWSCCDDDSSFTHWMPMPVPPEIPTVQEISTHDAIRFGRVLLHD